MNAMNRFQLDVVSGGTTQPKLPLSFTNSSKAPVKYLQGNNVVYCPPIIKVCLTINIGVLL